MPIEQLADTALLTAYARAVESDRVDALFRDTHARQLAGARGAALADDCAALQTMVDSIACRTAVFDELIMQIIREERVDLVVSLAAGLDMRPWRLPVPRELRWIDIDRPSVLEHKRSHLLGCEAYCCYGQQPADITNAGELDRALAGIDSAQGALFVSEGLLVYMSDAEVATLAARLRDATSTAWWITDLAGPRALGMMTSAWGQVLQGASFQFAPSDSEAFFQRVGWEEAEFRSSHEEGRRLGRVTKRSWLGRAALALTTSRFREQVRRVSGVAVLHKRPR